VGGVAATTTRPSPPRVEHLPMYRVLLHNDDKSEMGDVVRTIVELTPLSKQEATEAMIEAHKTGVALLLVTHRERAELYQDQFRTRRLSITIEPVA
jgi:ATP-dependent Clp protease adaptor protein ClpS